MRSIKSKFASVEFKNSSIGLLSQAISIVLLFVSRSVFIEMLGVQLLGINGTFTSILNALSLAELGFQSAIVYCLYGPLNQKDYEQVNDIINIIRRVYEGVAVFIIVASFVVLPFLQFVLKDVEITREIYIFFLLQSLATAASYILGYRRTILYADKKEYISKITDTVSNLLFTIGKIVILMVWQNYYLYLILQILQIFIANIIIYVISSRNYTYLKKKKINKELFQKVFDYVKDVFVGRIAGYIYSSTDNIVVSTLIGATTVGVLGNYSLVASNLKTLSSAMLNPLTPIIGNALAVESESKNKKKLFESYTKIRFVIAVLLVVPMVILIDDFVKMYAGQKYLLGSSITWLFAIDLYIHVVHSVCCDFINGEGVFKPERNIEIAGAVCNIVLSVILTFFIGLQGVLLGTVISQFLFWIGRSWLVYRRILQEEVKEYIRYALQNIIYFVILMLCFMVAKKLYAILPQMSVWLKMICGGFLVEGICILLLLIIERIHGFRR